MSSLIVIAHNIRSTHNIGSIFRTCDGFGVEKLILSGYTPYPELPKDERLPHLRAKISHEIHKTALGAETMVKFEYQAKPNLVTLKRAGYVVVGLEQTASSVNLTDFIAPKKVALILGEEVNGIPHELLEQCDRVVEIAMKGQKESFNVSVATGIALYQLSTNIVK